MLQSDRFRRIVFSLLSAAIVVTLFLAVDLSGRQSRSMQPSGQITKPIDGQTVTSYIEVEGTVSNIPSDMHVWVTVRVGNQHWPKEPEVSSREGAWRIEVFEPGPGKPFSLVLMMVDEDGSQKIDEWFNRGNKTGHYPGFAKVPGSITLDVVNNLRIE